MFANVVACGVHLSSNDCLEPYAGAFDNCCEKIASLGYEKAEAGRYICLRGWTRTV